MNKEQLKQVYAYLEGKKQEMINVLKEVVNIDSYSRMPEKVYHMAEQLKKLFEAEGLKCQIIDVGANGPTLVGVLGEDRPEKPVIFSGHMDTQVHPDDFPNPLFRIEGEKAFGSGVLDMKGGIVISLFVIKALNSIGYTERPLKIAYSGDEEIGHAGSNGAEVLKEAARGGVCSFNLETGLPDNSLCYGRKGRIEAHVTVHGVEAHAGNDFLVGRNSIAEMAHKITEIQNLTDLEKGTTVTCGKIAGGTVCNAVPKTCYMEVECRFDTVGEMNRFKESLEAICAKTYIDGTTTEVKYESGFAPYEASEQVLRFWEFIKNTASECGLEEVRGKKLGGSSDAAYIQMADVPVICSCGIQGQWNHTVNEYAMLDSLVSRSKLITSVILNLKNFK